MVIKIRIIICVVHFHEAKLEIKDEVTKFFIQKILVPFKICSELILLGKVKISSTYKI